MIILYGLFIIKVGNEVIPIPLSKACKCYICFAVSQTTTVFCCAAFEAVNLNEEVYANVSKQLKPDAGSPAPPLLLLLRPLSAQKQVDRVLTAKTRGPTDRQSRASVSDFSLVLGGNKLSCSVGTILR